MNRSTLRSDRTRPLLIALAGLAAGAAVAAPALASPMPRADSPKAAPTPPEVVYYDDDDARPESVTLQIDNGETKLWVDGERVPEGRFRIEDDGRVVLLDDKGAILYPLDVFAHRNTGASGKVSVFSTAPRADAPSRGLRFFEPARVPDVAQPTPPVMVGVNMSTPSPALRYHLGLSDDKKAILIDRVLEGLPAQVAGLKRYDVIVSIEGSEGASNSQLYDALMSKQPGDPLNLMVIRAGKPAMVTLELVAYNAEKLSAADKESEQELRLSVRPDGEELEWFPFGDDPNARDMLLRNRELTEAQLRALLEERLAAARSNTVTLDRNRLVVRPEAAREYRELAEQYARQAQQLAERGLHASGRELDERIVELEDRLAQMEDKLASALERLADRLDRVADRLERDDED